MLLHKLHLLQVQTDRHTSNLTQKLGEKRRLVVVFRSNTDCVQEHQDDDEPVEPLLLHGPPDAKPEHTSIHYHQKCQ